MLEPEEIVERREVPNYVEKPVYLPSPPPPPPEVIIQPREVPHYVDVMVEPEVIVERREFQVPVYREVPSPV